MSPEGLGAPVNVIVRRISPTDLEVTWDPPTYHGIAGYRVYYNTFAAPNMDHWLSIELGQYTVVEISGLEPHTVYAVRVRAKSTDGSYGNYSDIVVSNKLEHGMSVICRDCFLFVNFRFSCIMN